MEIKEQFQIDLANLINRHSIENTCNVPDWVLAKFLVDQIKTFAGATNTRDKWFGFNSEIVK